MIAEVLMVAMMWANAGYSDSGIDIEMKEFTSLEQCLVVQSEMMLAGSNWKPRVESFSAHGMKYFSGSILKLSVNCIVLDGSASKDPILKEQLDGLMQKRIDRLRPR